MELPEFITTLPALDLPFPPEVVRTYALPSERGLMVIFEVLQDTTLPMHAHKGQWGTVLEGSVELTIGDDTRIYGPGQSYNIPAGVQHGANVPAGTKVLELFEEPDRYDLRT